MTTSTTYCPILHDIFKRAKIPMISIGDRAPFEAALFAKCHFTVALKEKTDKINDMIGENISFDFFFSFNSTKFQQRVNYFIVL